MSTKIKTYFKAILAVMVVLLSSNGSELYATHIVGSDMTFQCLGNDFYQVNLTVRRDCINGADDAPFDDPAFAGVFDNLGNPLPWLWGSPNGLEMELLGIEAILPSMPDCSFMGGQLCTEEARYQATVYLPFREKGYVIAYQRCCRNQTLNNIIDPLNTGTTSFVCLTETTLTSCNSMPVFGDWPEVVICANQPLSFDHAATDADGDSLSYMLFTPHSGATEARPKPVPPPGPQYDTVEWAAGFGLDNLLGAGDPLQIDPVTGRITAEPGLVGQYLVGVLVVEWRDGVALSKTRRNFEYNVRVCEDVADLSCDAPELTCDGLTVEFNNTSGENFGFNWNFNYPSDDPAFQSTEESPTFTFPEEGFYTVRLSSTNPESNCEVFIEKEIGVFNSEVAADFNVQAGACDGNSRVLNLISTGVEPNEDYVIDMYQWEVVVGDQVLPLFGQSVQVTIDCVEEIMVSHTVVSSNGCSNQIVRTEQLPDEPIDLICLVGDTVRICEGESIELFDCNLEGVVYDWSPTDGLTFSDPTTQSGPVASPDETTLYTVTVSDGLNSDESTVLVIVDPKPNFELGVDSVELCRSGSQMTTIINGDPNFGYSWSPGDQVNTNSPYGPNDPLFMPTGDGYFYVTVTNPDNPSCFIVDSVYVTAIGNDPVALDNAVDIDSTVVINDDGTIGLTVDVNWDELNAQFDIDSVYWTITTSEEVIEGNGMDISATLQPTTSATVCIFIVDSEGCTTKITRIISFEELPDPEIRFIEDDTISVCFGETSFIVSNPNSEWTYTWEPEDGLIFEDPNDRSNPTISPTVSQYYVVTVSNGVTSITDSIFIEALPEISVINVTDAEICSGVAIINATNTPDNGIFDFEWSLDPDFSTIVATGGSVEIETGQGPVAVYVRTRGSNECGENTRAIDLVVDDYGITQDITPINTCISNEGGVSLIIPDTSDVEILWTASDNITSEDLTSSMIDVVALEGMTDDIELSYQVTDSEGCISTQTVTVPVEDELIVGIEGDEFSCTTTGTFNATANANLDSVNFEWALDPDFTNIIGTGSDITADLGETGVIYLRGTAGDCVSNVASQELEMRDLDFEVDAPNRICLGDTADVDIIIPDGESYTITWEAADEIISELSGTEVIITAPGGKDTITLVYTADDGNGCVVTNEVKIPYSTVIPPNPVNEIVCGTLDQNFMIDPIYMDGDVLWDFGFTTSTSAAPSVTFDSAGVYQGNISSTMETCNFDDTQFFFEVPEILMIETDQDPNQLVCEDQTSLMLRATSNGNAITWTDQDGNLLAVGDSVEVDLTSVSTVTATTSDANGCTMETVFSISPYMFDVTTDAPAEGVCIEGGELVINAMSGQDLTYMWSSESGAIIGGADSSSVRVNVADASDLMLMVTDNVFGCSTTIAVPVNLGTIETGITSDAPDNTIEIGGSTTLTVTPMGDQYTYMWEDGSTDPVRMVSPTETTTYTVVVTDTLTGCMGEAMITITVEQNCPSSIVSSEGTSVERGQSTTLTVDPQGAQYTYMWEDGSTDNPRVVSPTENPTTYTVTVTDTDTGCMSEASITISVTDPLCDEDHIFLPSAFSPNGDNVNDELIVRGNGIQSVDLQVIDRWGKEVFRGTTLGQGWNGRHKNNGDELAPDVYAYCAIAVCPDGTEIGLTGHVNLIR